jgi:zinc transporter ZupT
VVSSPLLVSASFTVVAVLSAAAGVWLTSLPSFSRRLVPFSGGLLMGVALFWLLPEMAGALSWRIAIAWTAGGFAALALIDRFVYPVCPACSDSHQHADCETRLHGFAVPLLIAASLHSGMDGWLAASSAGAKFGPALLLAIGFHKAPEGLALGVITRASLSSRGAALGWCALAESATLAGAGLQQMLAPHLDPATLYVVLAIAAGSFLYLGGHAIHGELRRSGAAPAFWPALTGVAGSSVLRLFVS